MDVSVVGRYHEPMPGVINKVFATLGVTGDEPYPSARPSGAGADDASADFYSTPRHRDDADYIGQHRAPDEDVVVS